jgi:hypothetical protein
MMIRNTYDTVVPIYESMNHYAPLDELVMAITMPEMIRARHAVWLA